MAARDGVSAGAAATDGGACAGPGPVGGARARRQLHGAVGELAGAARHAHDRFQLRPLLLSEERPQRQTR